MKPALSIFEYSDYRRYLRDYYEAKRKENGCERFTYGRFAEMCGFQNEATIRRIIHGIRNVASNRIDRLAKILFDESSAQDYFADLIRFNQSHEVEEGIFYFNKIGKHLQENVIETLDDDTSVLLSKWYYVFVRELVQLPDFQDNPSWVASRLRRLITPSEAEDAMRVLLTRGFIKKVDGRYVVINDNIRSGEDIAQRLLNMFHLQTIKFAMKAVTEQDPEEREIHSVTVSLDKATYEKVKEAVRETLRNTLNEARSVTKPEDLYQFNIQLFKVT